MPAIGLRSWLLLRSGKPLPPKPRRYQGMMAMQLLLFFMASLPTSRNGVGLFRLSAIPAWIILVSVAYLVLVAIRIKAAWPRVSQERKQRARLILPESPSEMRYWIPISVLAGVCEEYAYRGVAYAALLEITGAPVVSVALCVMAFAIAHIIQGWRGVLGAALLALIFHLVVFQTQTLLLAMAIHASYDLIVGFLGMKALMRDAAQRSHEPSAVP